MPRILMIVGSLREQSFNRQLAREVIRIIGNRAEVEELDWHDVPLMNQDIEWPTPEAVQRARDAVTRADVLWFCSPELVLLARIQLSNPRRTEESPGLALSSHR